MSVVVWIAQPPYPALRKSGVEEETKAWTMSTIQISWINLMLNFFIIVNANLLHLSFMYSRVLDMHAEAGYDGGDQRDEAQTPNKRDQ